MSVQQQEVFIIGGREYLIRQLTVAETRKIMPIIQRLIPIIVDDEATQDLGAALTLVFANALSEEDLNKLIAAFMPTTQVVMTDGGPAPLSASQDAVWQGQIEVMYEWVDTCIQYNFKSLLGKSKAAVKKAVARAEAAAKKAEEAAASK